MPPEMMLKKNYNKSTDIFSFGVLAFELLTGKKPWKAKTNGQLDFKKLNAEFEPIPEYYSKQLKDLIFSMMNNDPKKRPSIEKILSEINQMLVEVKDEGKNKYFEMTVWLLNISLI